MADGPFLPPHIVVLVHGNNGSPADFDAMAAALTAKFGDGQLLVVQSKSNAADTSLGVEVGGSKLAAEVVEAVLALELRSTATGYKLSIVGHSLGGLYSRFAIPQIMERLAMLNIDYVSFVTICTPHLGSRRARGPSTFKNILRIGVHKVLATKKLYGQTGIDLLIDVQSESASAASSSDEELSEGSRADCRPLLEVMSDPDSEFIRALKKFQHGTLVAMTDGDVVVPFPSASMRSYSPYKSTFLTERFADWRWHIRHSGFIDDHVQSTPRSAFLQRLDEHVDHSVEVEEHAMGLDAASTPRYPSIEGYDCDNKQEVEFPYKMLCQQQQALPWRRIDVTVEPSGVKGKLRLHDWPINKMQPPGCRADEFIDLLCDMIGLDHGMIPVVVPDVPGGEELAAQEKPVGKGSDSTATSHETASSTMSPTSSGNVSSDTESYELFPSASNPSSDAESCELFPTVHA